MYNVLIVEDEMLVRMGIKAAIKWEELGLTIIGDATDGLSGLEIYKKHRPHIVITDINLPRLNGVELIQKIYELDKDCAIIVITCVEDLNILKGLLEYHIVDYLVKASISAKEINESLQKAMKRLGKINVEPERIKDQQVDVSHHIKSYLGSNENEVREVNFDLDEYSPYMILHHLYEVDKRTDMLINTLVEIILKYFEKLCQVVAIRMSKEDILLLLKGKNIEKDILMASIERCESYLLKVLNAKVLLSVENYKNCPETMKRSCRRFKEYLKSYSDHEVLSQTCEDFTTRFHKKISRHVEMTIKVFEGMMVEGTSYKEFVNLKEILTKDIYFFDEYKRTIIRLLQHMQREEEADANHYLKELERDVLGETSYVNVYHCLKYGFSLKVDQLYRKVKVKKEVIHAVDYISQHYKECVTLEDVAREVAFSPNYLSSKFKDELGLSFVDFLIRYRIEKAKELIENSNDYLYIIAEESGFSNESYLGKKFKKIVGCSPMEWKKYQINKI